MIKEGRQYATSLAEIRSDHTHRYFWAAEQVRSRTVVDVGCGIGYGSFILARSGCLVWSYEKSQDAVDFGKKHWDFNDQIKWTVGDVCSVDFHRTSCAVAFEVIEHLENPETMLKHLNSENLFCSVPNQDVIPFDKKRNEYHHRHYTKDEFESLLHSSGWNVTDWLTQKEKISPVSSGHDGRILIARAKRS